MWKWLAIVATFVVSTFAAVPPRCNHIAAETCRRTCDTSVCRVLCDAICSQTPSSLQSMHVRYASNTDRELPSETYQALFRSFIQQHQKHYHVNEFRFRYATFRKNVDRIRRHNAMNHSYRLALNHLADMEHDEFRTSHLGYRLDLQQPTRVHTHTLHQVTNQTLPPAVDWVQRGAVTPVKNQGQCGSCWSFSATGAVEGAWFLHKGELVSLSEQQLVDCSVAQGNQGCNGGLMDQAFQFIIAHDGICSEADYPYTGSNGACQANCSSSAIIRQYVDVTPHDETALQTAVAMQPVSIALEADQSIFQFYSSGVLDDATCGVNLDHGVLVVGYGHDQTLNKDFWTVKNSWGPNWGDRGYIRIVRNVDGNDARQCGLASVPSYPVV